MQLAAAPECSLDSWRELENRVWLERLRSSGATYDDAVGELHALLLRAARFEANRRTSALASLRPGEVEEVAQDAAADALVAVLARLDRFNGASRFTTWAYKFALLEASVKFRRRYWQDREIPVADETWQLFESVGHGPRESVEQRLVLDRVRDGIATVLTPHQRDVLLALAVAGVPVDVLADRLGSTRGALYKTLHDARRRLRAHLADAGLSVEGGDDD